MEANTIHGTVREGSTLYMPGNQDHADALCEILTGRSCARLVEGKVVSGDGFEEKAREYASEQATVDESGGKADMPVLEEPEAEEVVEEPPLVDDTVEEPDIGDSSDTPWNSSGQAPGLDGE